MGPNVDLVEFLLGQPSGSGQLTEVGADDRQHKSDRDADDADILQREGGVFVHRYRPARADGDEPDGDRGAAHQRGHSPPGVEPLPEKGEEDRRQVGRRRDDERHPRDEGGGVGGGADTSRQPDREESNEAGRDARDEMRIDLRLPQQFSALRIHCVDDGVSVAEIHGVARRALTGDGSDGQSIPHDRAILKGPIDAAGGGVQRVHEAVVAADEDASGSHRRLSVGGLARRIPERPLQLQPWHLRSREARALRRLEPRVSGIRAPSIPCRAVRRIGERRIVAALVGHVLRVTHLRAAQRPAAHEFRDPLFLNIAQALGVHFHGTRHERVVNPFGRHLTNRGCRRRALYRVVVADRTAGLERGQAALGPGCSGGWARSCGGRLLCRR